MPDLSPKNFQKEIDDLFSAYRIDEQVFNKEQLAEQKLKLKKLCKVKGANPELLLDLAKKNLQEGEELSRFSQNVFRKKAEVAVAKADPGKVDVAKFLKQINEQIPLLSDQSKSGWNPKKSGYADNAGPASFTGRFFDELRAIRGFNNEEIKQIWHDDRPIVEGGIISQEYQEKVTSAELNLYQEISAYKIKNEYFFDKGELPSKEEIAQKVQEQNKSFVLTTAAKNSDRILRNLVDAAGKGIISNTKAQDTSDFRKYLLKRNGLLSGVVNNSVSDLKDRTAHIKDLKRQNAELLKSGLVEDFATYFEMEALLDSEMKIVEAENAKILKELDDKTNAISTKTLDGLQAHIDKKDDAWKWHVISMVLIVSPFSPALIVAGPMFNYMGFVSQILDPVFNAGSGFAHGIGSIVTNPAFGPISNLTQAMRLDQGIEGFLNNMPIVNSVAGDDGIIDFLISNPISQNLIGESGAVLTSPLALLAIAGVAAAVDLDSYFEREKDKTNFLKGQKEKLKSVFNELDKTVEEKNNEDLKRLAKNRIDILKSSSFYQELIDFIRKSDAKTLSIFDDIKIEDPDKNEVKLSDKAMIEKVNDLQLFAVLKDSGQDQEALKKFKLFSALQDESKSVEENLRRFKIKSSSANSKEANELIEEQGQKLNQKFILKYAQKNNLITEKEANEILAKNLNDDAKKQLNILENRIVADEKENIKILTLTKAYPNPNNVEKPISASPLPTKAQENPIVPKAQIRT